MSLPQSSARLQQPQSHSPSQVFESEQFDDRNATGNIVSRIEGVLASVVAQVNGCEELSIEFDPDGSRWGRLPNGRRPVTLKYPGRNAQEALKFTQVLILLQLSHDALVAGTILTKRHIYYQNTELFGSQRRVDVIVEGLARTFNIQRHELNIVATSKGVMAGPLTVKVYGQGDRTVDASTSLMGVQIPPPNLVVSMDTSQIRWILVVEKDAVFRALLSQPLWQVSKWGSGLLITAKGYPDQVTHGFIHLLAQQAPHVPIMGLVDFDPDGVNIYRCYRYGSGGFGPLLHSMTLMGLNSQQLLDLASSAEFFTHHSSCGETPRESPPAEHASLASTRCREPVGILSTRDRKAAIGTLGRLHDGPLGVTMGSRQLQRELQVMLMMGVKTEIQWLDESGSLLEWVNIQLGLQIMNAALPHSGDL